MEVKVTIVKQCPLREKKFDTQEGQRVIKSVDVVMTNGIDVFVAEATGTLADVLKENPLKIGSEYLIGLSLSVRYKNNNENDLAFNNVSISRLPFPLNLK